MKKRTRRLTTLAITVSIAMILSYIESRIPTFIAIPGIKLGLANIAVIFTLYKLGAKEAAVISLIRVALISMLFGSPVSFIYSFTGAVFSLISMILLKKLTPLTALTISVTGGVMHNVGQVLAACFMLSTDVIIYYLPFLLVSGTVAGIVVGTASALLVNRVKINYE